MIETVLEAVAKLKRKWRKLPACDRQKTQAGSDLESATITQINLLQRDSLVDGTC